MVEFKAGNIYLFLAVVISVESGINSFWFGKLRTK